VYPIISLRLNSNPTLPERISLLTCKRAFDVFLSLLLLVLLSPLLLVLALCIKITSTGSVLYWSDRAGKKNRLFRMPKLRSMRIDTPQGATHLLADPTFYLNPLWRFPPVDELRRTASNPHHPYRDQSFVGLRPALFNQDDLIALRTERGIHQLVTGLTGWAQVNRRDDLLIPVKVEFDREYLERQSFAFDFHIFRMTAFQVMRRELVHH
jgi:O-antigen biosynthesis protein WbqP